LGPSDPASDRIRNVAEPERSINAAAFSQFVMLAVDPGMNGETAWFRN
jgi:hypothetical protein